MQREKNWAPCPPVTCCHRVNRQEQHCQRRLRQRCLSLAAGRATIQLTLLGSDWVNNGIFWSTPWSRETAVPEPTPTTCQRHPPVLCCTSFRRLVSVCHLQIAGCAHPGATLRLRGPTRICWRVHASTTPTASLGELVWLHPTGHRDGWRTRRMIPPLLGKQKQLGGSGFLKCPTVVIPPLLLRRPTRMGFTAEFVWWNGKRWRKPQR